MHQYLMVETVDDDVTEVEFDGGLRTDLPLAWFPAGTSEGNGFRVEADGNGGVRFLPDERAARVIRERNKQTLLDFSDDLD